VYQGNEENLGRARMVTFCTVAFTQLCYSFACRSQRRTLPELGLFSNPHLLGAIAFSALLQIALVLLPFARPLFETEARLTWEWLLIFGLALTPVTLIEVAKLVRALLPGGQPAFQDGSRTHRINTALARRTPET